ncbi:MAG: L-ribulose-5-phosphate 3-epimerase [Clostridiales bacterium]|nr:L-ribulose-5-phosphate 3-epimerase [Clostridiales bacterium]
MKAYSLGLYEKSMPSDLSWREKLTAAKEAGFDYVEISIDASEDKIQRIYMPKAERLEIIRAMYETGIPIRTMCVSALTKYSLGNDDPKLEARGMEILEKSIELADDLGVRVVMIPGYDVYYEPSSVQTKHRFLKNLKTASHLAERAGVILGLETMENEFMNTVEKAMKYVILCGSNYLKVYPDIGNLTNAAVQYQTDVLEDLELGRGNITSLHLKETKPGVYREIPYGTGHVDFEAAIAKAWEMGIRRYVTEFWYKGSDAWRDDLVFANRMMAGILDRQENISDDGAAGCRSLSA